MTNVAAAVAVAVEVAATVGVKRRVVKRGVS